MSFEAYFNNLKGEPPIVSFEGKDYPLPNLAEKTWVELFEIIQSPNPRRFDNVLLETLPVKLVKKLSQAHKKAIIKTMEEHSGISFGWAVSLRDILEDSERELSLDLLSHGFLGGIPQLLNLPPLSTISILKGLFHDMNSYSRAKFIGWKHPFSQEAWILSDIYFRSTQALVKKPNELADDFYARLPIIKEDEAALEELGAVSGGEVAEMTEDEVNQSIEELRALHRSKRKKKE